MANEKAINRKKVHFQGTGKKLLDENGVPVQKKEVDGVTTYQGSWQAGGILFGLLSAWGAYKVTLTAVNDLFLDYQDWYNNNKDNKNAVYELDISGWSRGGVTGLLVAKYLGRKIARMSDKNAINRLHVNIIATDPVPGNIAPTGMTKYGIRFANQVADLSECRWIKHIDMHIGNLKPKDFLSEISHDTIIPKINPQHTTMNIGVEHAGHEPDCTDCPYLFSDSSNQYQLNHDMTSEEKLKIRVGLTGGRFGYIYKASVDHDDIVNKQNQTILFQNTIDYKIFKTLLALKQAQGDKFTLQDIKKVSQSYHKRKWYNKRYSEKYETFFNTLINTKDIDQYRPQFVLGSLRLYHEPTHSVVNAIDMNDDNIVQSVYQRIMSYLDLAMFRLPNQADKIKALQNQLQDKFNSEDCRVDDLIEMIQNEEKMCQFKKPLQYILQDKDHLFHKNNLTLDGQLRQITSMAKAPHSCSKLDINKIKGDDFPLFCQNVLNPKDGGFINRNSVRNLFIKLMNQGGKNPLREKMLAVFKDKADVNNNEHVKLAELLEGNKPIRLGDMIKIVNIVAPQQNQTEYKIDKNEEKIINLKT